MKSRTPGPVNGARRRATRLGSVLLGALLVLGACGSAEETPQEQLPSTSDLVEVERADVADGGLLRLGAERFPANFNPWHVDGADEQTQDVLSATRGGVVRVAPDGSWDVDANHARKVTVSKKSPLTVEVQLEPKAVWEDGTPITAKDMASFVSAVQDERFHASAHPAFAFVKKVEVLSKFKYRVVFSEPVADWPAAISPGLPISATKSPKAFNEGFQKKAVPSNGPFRVARISSGKSLVLLERNPRWWGPEPKLEQIEWRFADAATLGQVWGLDGLDVLVLDTTGVEELRTDPALRVSLGSEWTQVTMNGAKGPLADVKVRKAVAAAVGRSDFAVLESSWSAVEVSPLDTVVRVPGQTGHRSLGIEPEPRTARKLLANAGWKDVDGKAVRKEKQLKLSLPVVAGSPRSLARAELLKDQLASVGVDVEVEEVAVDKFWNERVVRLDFDLVIYPQKTQAFSLLPTMALFTPLDGALNFTGTGKGKHVTAFKKSLSTTMDKSLLKSLPKLEKAVAEQASIIPLTLSVNSMLVREGVVNFGPVQFGGPDWTSVGWWSEDN